jgi:hypothetical protein
MVPEAAATGRSDMASWNGPQRPWGRVVTLALLPLVLGGCGNLRLHSDVRQKQGEAASAAWKEVDVKGLFAAERQNQGKLLDTEIAAWDRSFANRHETEIRTLARITPLGRYVWRVNLALSPMVGSQAAATQVPGAQLTAVDGASAALQEEAAAQKRLDNASSLMQSGGVPKFTCEQLTGPAQAVVQAWTDKNSGLAQLYASQLQSARFECGEISQARAAYLRHIQALPGGVLERRYQVWEAAQQELLRLQSQVDQKKIALDAAQKAYDQEAASLKSGRSTVDKVKEEGAKVQQAIQAVQAAGDVFGIELASKERLERIDALLDSLSAGTPLESDAASKLETGISMLPPIIDGFKAINLSGKGRAAAPLLLQRDLEQAKLAAASALAARKQQDIEILRAMLAASVRQAVTYRNAIVQLSRACPVGKPGCDELIGTGFAHLPPTDRRQLLQGTVYYLDALNRQEALIKAMELQRIGLLYQQSIDLAESNASAWSALVSTSVGQAAEFSALGLKASDIDKILGLIGLFYIGHGVNK